MPWLEIFMSASEMAYLRHKGWSLGYYYPKARTIDTGDLFGFTKYLFMSGIEQAQLVEILHQYRRDTSVK